MSACDYVEFSGRDSAVIEWLDIRGLSCELREDPFNPRRDRLLIYAENGEVEVSRGEVIVIRGGTVSTCSPEDIK